jgi:hypothetical protein
LGGCDNAVECDDDHGETTVGKTVGQEVLSFQRRDAPLEIQAHMHHQIRVWHTGKRDKDQWGGGSNRTKPGRTTAELLQPQAKRSVAWGREPVGGWTREQTKAWEREQHVSTEASKAMEERVLKAVREFRKDPSAVTKKTAEAIRNMGVRPDSRLVAKLAAQVVAYRQASRGAAAGVARS